MDIATTEVNTSLNHPIYRFKFDDSIVQLLFQFAKVHQYDERQDYKEAWATFIDDNQEQLSREVTRLKLNGYEGDCFDKMYKSARYYFRKKSTSKTEPKSRRKYISTDRDLLDAMDEHINVNMKNNIDFKPSDGYDNFILNNQNMIKKEVERIIDSGFTNTKAIVKKIKKTYKNRYFLIINSNQ